MSTKITLNEMLRKLGPDFGFLKEEIGAMQPVERKGIEQDVSNRLDKSAKLDEVDTVTFGLETDDGKIVKVYVKVDDAADFEKALSDKLGEVDDIEQVLNDLSKEYEIVDVEWPEGDERNSSNDEEASAEASADDQTGASALDPQVFNKDLLRKETSAKLEGLSYGEEVALELVEDGSTSIQNRFTTSYQLMVYHAILELGVPEIALARSPYRAKIIAGIKTKALEVSKHPNVKSMLKSFIDRSLHQHKLDDKHKVHAEPPKHADKPTKEATKHHIRESEEKAEWEFSNDDGVVKIAYGADFAMKLDPEESEKLIKGLANSEVTVVTDMEDPKAKFVFSPRGVQALVKRVGTTQSVTLTSKQIDDLTDTMGEKSKKPAEKEEPKEKDAEAGDKKPVEDDKAGK